MAIFPRPVSPRSAASDLREMFAPDRPHRWSILALSVTLTGVLLWGFAIDSRKPGQERQIIYIENWEANRPDSAIIQRQIEDFARYRVALESKQGEFQRLADSLGIDWREDAARTKREREELFDAKEKELQQKLAAALAKEGGVAGNTATATP
ncbi:MULTISPECIES: OmpH family outer membrane protein [unclassified Sphingobium]|uniref:OmpH family outer membrane protein n=1 Tax=unclassified Sphingobium TaxID=2611147 RepID=UPI0022251A7C|nr:MULTISPECIES: OmpH family outer membrane protein [unclassified Sphingobium]MCW2348905.1 hypothetical protein [Sphingobium sp. B12D2B]MCW2368032.1 hypothetical protein [Sphingobium sp. B11D3D]